VRGIAQRPTLPTPRHQMAPRQSPRAVFDKDIGPLSNLLSAAGFSGAIKESIIETVCGAGEIKAR